MLKRITGLLSERIHIEWFRISSEMNHKKEISLNFISTDKTGQRVKSAIRMRV